MYNRMLMVVSPCNFETTLLNSRLESLQESFGNPSRFPDKRVGQAAGRRWVEVTATRSDEKGNDEEKRWSPDDIQTNRQKGVCKSRGDIDVTRNVGAKGEYPNNARN